MNWYERAIGRILEKLYPFRHFLLSWSTLATFSRSVIARYSFVWIAVVPLTAQLLTGVNSYVRVEFLGYRWQLHLELPFSWQLFFFGSLCAATASWLFYIGCPSLIRDHRDFASLTAAGQGVDQVAKGIDRPALLGLKQAEWRSIADILFRVLDNDGVDFGKTSEQVSLKALYAEGVRTVDSEVWASHKLYRMFSSLQSEIVALHRINEARSHDNVSRMFWAVRDGLEYSKSHWRLPISLLTLAALICFGIVGCQNAVKVANYVARSDPSQSE